MFWGGTAARICDAGEAPWSGDFRRSCVLLLAIVLFGGRSTWSSAQAIAPLRLNTAQEIAPFRFTGVEGYTTTRYLHDNYSTAQPAGGLGAGLQSRQGQTSLRQEAFVMTHSYVYHPNLLSLDIGGGPILQTGSSSTDSSDTRIRGELYNFTGRATFLRDKPYQGSAFFEHLNPTLNVAPGQVLAQENTRYGFDFSLLAPVTTVPIHLDATRSHFQASGSDRIVDDQIDRLNLRATKSYGTLGDTQFHYQSTRQESLSGSPNLPVQGSTSSSQGFNADSRFKFGNERQYDLTNMVAINTQSFTLGRGALAERRDMRMFFDARARHSDQIHTFGTYNFSTSGQGELGTTVNTAAAGVNYWPIPDLATTLGARGEQNRTTEFVAQSRGLDGSARYRLPLPVGIAQASYALRHDQREQQAVAGLTPVIGERITLTGTTTVTLAHQRITGSSVVVSNASRTQTLVEGRDYALSVVGIETRLQRLVGGNIVDGQEVLVDYSYDVGGSFAYQETAQTLSFNWSLLSYLNIYLRHFNSAPRLTAGTSTFLLNAIQSSLYGARVDVPLRRPFEIMLGGSLEGESRQETIAPYRREAQDVYVQAEDPFFGIGNFRLSAHRARVDYENSLQNVNLKGYDIRFSSRTWFGLDVSADANFETDTGTPVTRSRSLASIKAQWRYSKVNLTAELSRSNETQGAVERTRDLIQILMRRDF